MEIFFYKGLTRILEIQPHLSFTQIWRLGQVEDTTFRMNVSNDVLLNAERFQSYTAVFNQKNLSYKNFIF